jgi:tyrosine decarboxylase/aspartate 1-decarboxylase
MKNDKYIFPEKKGNGQLISEEIKPSRKSPRTKGGFFMGYPHTQPLKIATQAMHNYLKYNSNHVGMVSASEQPLTKSRELEKEAIKMLGNLFGADDVDGYINSGSTEGNIFGLMIGHAYLDADINDIVLITSDLAHHSIDKASKLMSIKNFEKIEVNTDFSIDADKLIACLKKYIANGIKKFILVLTSGYTCTGTEDNIFTVNKNIKELKSKNNFDIYIHIDAAIGGFVFPFLGSGNYFHYDLVQSITTDPHKMGYVPFPAGVFLCRTGLQNKVRMKINYVEEIYDDTLIGSRNGASAVAVWATIKALGKEGFTERLKSLNELKNYILNSFSKNQILVVSKNEMNMVCFSLPGHCNSRLPEWIEDKYTLDRFELTYNGKPIVCYKIYIMPHITKSTVRLFVNDIASILKGKVDYETN